MYRCLHCQTEIEKCMDKWEELSVSDKTAVVNILIVMTIQNAVKLWYTIQKNSE